MKLSKTQRETIRLIFGGKCAYCGIDLPEKGWQADHVEPVVRGGRGLDFPDRDVIENLWPSCRPCNINKSSLPLETWRTFLMDGPESLAGYNGRFKHMLRFGVVKVNPEPLLFWFERYSG